MGGFGRGRSTGRGPREQRPLLSSSGRGARSTTNGQYHNAGAIVLAKGQGQGRQPPTGPNMTTIPGRLSPRADLWAYLVVSSSAALATLSATASGVLDVAAIAAVSLALAVALFVAWRFRFERGRDQLTRPLGGGDAAFTINDNRNKGARIGKITVELILACPIFLLWCFVMGVALDAGRSQRSLQAGGGPRIASSNLFYSTWISFAIIGYVIADLLTTNDPRAVLPCHEYYRPVVDNPASRSWVLLLIASVTLLSFDLAVSNGEICSGELLMGTSLCQYTISGIVISFVGMLASSSYLFVEWAFPDKKHLHPLLGVFLSLIVMVVFAMNAGMATSPTLGSQGSELSSLYWSWWICFGLSAYLLVCHVEMFMESRTRAEPSETAIGGGNPSERVPLIKQQYHSRHHSRPLNRMSTSNGSGHSSSGSTYLDTASTSSCSDDDSSSRSGSKSNLALFPIKSSDGKAQQTRSTGPTNQFLYTQQAPTRRGPPQNTAQQATMNKKSSQAREKKKEMLFDKMNVVPPNSEANNPRRPAAAAVTDNKIPTEKSSFENNIKQYLKDLGLPAGLFSTVYQNCKLCDHRLWLVDNSSFMTVRDAHCIGGDMERIQKTNGVTRWHELQECVAFHAKMASRCWIPTKFWLVNDPKCAAVELSQKSSLCWTIPKDISSEMSRLRTIMTSSVPSSSSNPLTQYVRSVQRGIARESSRLNSHGKHATLVFCTQGIPTDERGGMDQEVMRALRRDLEKLSELPVRFVFRLCTVNEKVVDIYNTIDAQMDFCDVLDDYWGEALEVQLHNPWLTYGIGIHRLREAGLAWGLMTDLDRRPLSLDEIHQFCKLFFIGENNGGMTTDHLPHPRNWMSFVRVLTRILKKHKPVWNPVLRRQSPWINISMLHSMYRTGGPEHQRNLASIASRNDGLSLQQILQRWSHQPPGFQKLKPLDHLLVTFPEVFPPANTKVENHKYFRKWKTFAKDAFANTGDDLDKLLIRALIKAKFFLHPDKLPKDLTEDQALVFRVIWDAIQDPEFGLYERIREYKLRNNNLHTLHISSNTKSALNLSMIK
mmetsp:Transcript_11546/g.28447  ORF Transcript_11546/g.28447 Transcript_11546/m.28447 type:complete len:1057 (-) Transcript_11546:58-3228(-)